MRDKNTPWPLSLSLSFTNLYHPPSLFLSPSALLSSRSFSLPIPSVFANAYIGEKKSVSRVAPRECRETRSNGQEARGFALITILHRAARTRTHHSVARRPGSAARSLSLATSPVFFPPRGIRSPRRTRSDNPPAPSLSTLARDEAVIHTRSPIFARVIGRARVSSLSA